MAVVGAGDVALVSFVDDNQVAVLGVGRGHSRRSCLRALLGLVCQATKAELLGSHRTKPTEKCKIHFRRCSVDGHAEARPLHILTCCASSSIRLDHWYGHELG